jgi:hypothetical protein
MLKPFPSLSPPTAKRKRKQSEAKAHARIHENAGVFIERDDVIHACSGHHNFIENRHRTTHQTGVAALRHHCKSAREREEEEGLEKNRAGSI